MDKIAFLQGYLFEKMSNSIKSNDDNKAQRGPKPQTPTNQDESVVEKPVGTPAPMGL